MPLKEKVKKSDLILVATVKSVEANKKPSKTKDSTQILATARRIAVIEVGQILKGRLKTKTTRVGFMTNTVFDATKLVVGKRYLLFLHSDAKLPFRGVTAWQFGSLQIFKDSTILGSLFGVKSAKLSLKDAMVLVKDVMKNKPHDPRYKPEDCPECPNPDEDM
ncbi:MAG: hypothetical protein P1V97_10525 [Planctomycetota bacterium]|nr:hypothetical protein [Planctomycetota bacterium]